MRLHPNTIEAVKERSDIVDVVSERVALKKQVLNLVGQSNAKDPTGFSRLKGAEGGRTDEFSRI